MTSVMALWHTQRTAYGRLLWQFSSHYHLLCFFCKYYYYPHRVCLSAWIRCLFVCLSVCLQHNSKTNDPKVFKLGVVKDLWIN